jgi:hypothetical protein
VVVCLVKRPFKCEANGGHHARHLSLAVFAALLRHYTVITQELNHV